MVLWDLLSVRMVVAVVAVVSDAFVLLFLPFLAVHARGSRPFLLQLAVEKRKM